MRMRGRERDGGGEKYDIWSERTIGKKIRTANI